MKERDITNGQVAAAIDKAALTWGVKVLRYEASEMGALVASAMRMVQATKAPGA